MEGIEGLSIGRLADGVGISKSGLLAHFGSKEELQLATVDIASALFAAQVTAASLGGPGRAGAAAAHVDGYLRYLEVENFPGGCFFASVLAEMDMRPGPVRDRLIGFLGDWLGRLETAVRDAQAEGAIDTAEDAGPAHLRNRGRPVSGQRAVRRRADPGTDRTSSPGDRAPAHLGCQRSEELTGVQSILDAIGELPIARAEGSPGALRGRSTTRRHSTSPCPTSRGGLATTSP